MSEETKKFTLSQALISSAKQTTGTARRFHEHGILQTSIPKEARASFLEYLEKSNLKVSTLLKMALSEYIARHPL